jgi:N-acetylmuramoyl-L-alanine amidase
MMTERLPDTRLAGRVCPSPNYSERRDGGRPELLILHYTGMPDENAALEWLCNPASEVSSHYLIFEDGQVAQLVPEGRRAWHAGVASWQGYSDINSFSIGIEIANPGHGGGLPPFPPPQVTSVLALARDIVTRWSIRPDRVLAHSDVAPGRKQDPGERFPWARLHAAGVGHWVEPAPIHGGPSLSRGDRGPPVARLQELLAGYGYPAPRTGAFDERTEAVVAAFQRHFRPERVDGIADPSTMATLRDLIATRPASGMTKS